MPVGSTEFGASNNNLRQMSGVKGELETTPSSMKATHAMWWFRPSIAWLMFAVAVLAVDCALLRAPGGRPDVELITNTGLVIMSDILAIGLFRIFMRRCESCRFLIRFEISGRLVVILFALVPYLEFCDPVVGAINRVIGAVSNRLVVLFWHPLSDFNYGDPFGRSLTFVILIFVPAMLLTMLLSAPALVGAFLWRRKD